MKTLISLAVAFVMLIILSISLTGCSYTAQEDALAATQAKLDRYTAAMNDFTDLLRQVNAGAITVDAMMAQLIPLLPDDLASNVSAIAGAGGDTIATLSSIAAMLSSSSERLSETLAAQRADLDQRKADGQSAWSSTLETILAIVGVFVPVAGIAGRAAGRRSGLSEVATSVARGRRHSEALDQAIASADAQAVSEMRSQLSAAGRRAVRRANEREGVA